jgi:hypothetical protein
MRAIMPRMVPRVALKHTHDSRSLDAHDVGRDRDNRDLRDAESRKFGIRSGRLCSFLIAIAWPMQSRLQSYLPELLALAIMILVTVTIFLIFASLVSWGFGRVGRSLVADAARFQLLYEQVTLWLEIHGVAVAGLLFEHFNMRWLIGTIQGVTARLNTTVTFWLVVLVYVILGLLEVNDISRKLHSSGSAMRHACCWTAARP